jgi:phosphoribosyl-ATP pyrophosphohydrolase/phosphoribosyl-AMP cyclohydrolase
MDHWNLSPRERIDHNGESHRRLGETDHWNLPPRRAIPGRMAVWDLKWDEAGLVTVVAQDRHSGEVRMVAHANSEALERTLETGEAHFFSRSRQALWKKGESSGNTLGVAELWVDCDGDCVLYLVEPSGPSCHTGRRSCFFRRVQLQGAEEQQGPGTPTLARLWDALAARARSRGERSYTKSLLDKGPPKIAGKVREEAEELAYALEQESDARVVSEAADVLYHLCVGLLARGVGLRDVEAELARRFGRSGHEEKASRSH